MERSRSRTGALALLLLVAHGGLGSVAHLAEPDATPGADPVLHVESAADEGCLPSHDPLDCRLCRVLGSHDVWDAGPAPAVPPGRFDGRLPRPASHPRVLAARAGALGARAPPERLATRRVLCAAPLGRSAAVAYAPPARSFGPVVPP